MKNALHISWILLTKPKQDIDGIMQERRNSIANALEYVFLALSHPYIRSVIYATAADGIHK